MGYRNYVGYRNYIGRIKKDDLTKLMLKMSYELKREATEELYEIGKYYSRPDDGFEIIYDLSDTDTEYMIITRDSLKAIIKQYSEMHLDYLKSLIKTDDELTNEEKAKKELGYLDTPKRYIEKKISEWKRPGRLVYDLGTGNRLVKSWAIEYEVFELVKIYKEFDEEKYHMVYRGY